MSSAGQQACVRLASGPVEANPDALRISWINQLVIEHRWITLEGGERVTATRTDSTARSATFDPTALVARARRITGATQDEPIGYLDGLARLCDALESQALLTEAGRSSAQRALVKALVNQIDVERRYRANPGVADIPIRPVFITGLLRTGTTFLQQLMATHPDVRSPRLWELMAPASPRPPAELVAESEAYVREYHRVAPRFEAIHPLDARQPEECHRLTGNTFRDPIYALRYHVPDYAAWLRGQSMVPTYEYHARQLRCLLAREPGNPVLLKGPSHLWYLDALAAVYPDARLIRLHRSPLVALPSVCSLTSVVRSARSDYVDDHEIGRYWLEQASRVLNGLHRGQAPTAVAPLDLRYDDLVADPVGTAERVCDHIGVPFAGRAADRITAFVAGQRNRSRGRHEYSAADFGLRPDRLAERFADYIAEFGL